MPILPKDNHCCGCAACFNACSHASIRVAQDEFGFFVPLVDESTCTECKACESACPTLPFLNFAPYDKVKRKSIFPLTLAESSINSASTPFMMANERERERESKTPENHSKFSYSQNALNSSHAQTAQFQAHENSQNPLNFSHAQASKTDKFAKNSQNDTANFTHFKSTDITKNSQASNSPSSFANFAFNKDIKMQNSLRFSPKLARLNEPVCLALKAKSKDLRLNSSSGGAFSLIAEFVLNHGGVVFGAAFDEHLKVRHIAVERLEDLGLLRRSKYVESFIGDSFTKAQNFLKSGRLVLFSGTQCQIHGLNAFLRKAYSNLITLEVICNSVPSAKVWEIYKQSLECEMGEKLTDFNFRGQDFKWEIFAVKHFFTTKTKIIPHTQEVFMMNFLHHTITRKSCGNCYSKGFVSGADFTLGDFWGIRSWHADFVDELGVSCVLAHSQKALEILQSLSQKCEIQATNLGVIALGNPALLHSNGVHPQRDMILREFFRIYETSKSAKKAVDYLATFMTNASQTPTKTGFFRHYYLVYKNDPIRKAISNALKRTRKRILNYIKKDKK